MFNGLLLQAEIEDRFKKEQEKFDREYDIKSIKSLRKEIKTMNKRLADPEHQMKQNDIDYIKKLEKRNRELWQFIMKSDVDVSELLENK